MEILFSNVIAIIAVVIAFFALRQSHEQTKASILIECLNTHIEMRRLVNEAVEKKSKTMCEEYYKELLDLHWTEFRLWQSGLIPRHVMKAWLDSRYRSFHDGDISNIPFKDNDGNDVNVRYRDVWEHLKEIKYFHTGDPFVKFMDLVHKGHIDDALKIRV